MQQYFVAPNEGRATITVKSRFSAHECSVTINVINKVFDEERIIHKSEEVYYAFSTVDFNSFVKIREYKLSDYDNKSYYIRDLREDEVLEYYIENSLVEPDDFNYSNNGYRGQEITVAIKNTNIKSNILNVYVIPNFTFSVNDNDYCLKDIEDNHYYAKEVLSLTNNDFQWFYGWIPVLNLNEQQASNSFEIIDTLEMQTDDLGQPRYSVKTRENKIILEYKFYYENLYVKQVYNLEILHINFIN